MLQTIKKFTIKPYFPKIIMHSQASICDTLRITTKIHLSFYQFSTSKIPEPNQLHPEKIPRIYQKIMQGDDQTNIQKILKEIELSNEAYRQNSLKLIIKKIYAGKHPLTLLKNKKFHQLLSKYPELNLQTNSFLIKKKLNEYFSFESKQNKKNYSVYKSVQDQMNEIFKECFDWLKQLKTKTSTHKNEMMIYKRFADYLYEFLYIEGQSYLMKNKAAFNQPFEYKKYLEYLEQVNLYYLRALNCFRSVLDEEILKLTSFKEQEGQNNSKQSFRDLIQGNNIQSKIQQIHKKKIENQRETLVENIKKQNIRVIIQTNAEILLKLSKVYHETYVYKITGLQNKLYFQKDQEKIYEELKGNLFGLHTMTMMSLDSFEVLKSIKIISNFYFKLKNICLDLEFFIKSQTIKSQAVKSKNSQAQNEKRQKLNELKTQKSQKYNKFIEQILKQFEQCQDIESNSYQIIKVFPLIFQIIQKQFIQINQKNQFDENILKEQFKQHLIKNMLKITHIFDKVCQKNESKAKIKDSLKQIVKFKLERQWVDMWSGMVKRKGFET